MPPIDSDCNAIRAGYAEAPWGYDAAGRRTSMGGSYARVNLPPALSSATYDAANKLTNWAGTAQTYDLNGNLTGDGTRTYTWDTRDRLTATSGGGQTSSYVYDAFGRRISRTISGSQTAYVHDGHNPVHTGTGSTITGTLLNGGGLDERYGRTVGGANTALLTDALGSLLHIVNAAGATTATYTYEPYGAVTHSGTDSTGFQYTGREVDVGGLMYYRARYYNPRTARFLSEDPIGLAGGVNTYAYVRGDPISRVDPDGLLDFDFSKFAGQIEANRSSNAANLAALSGTFAVGTMPKTPGELRGFGVPKGELNPMTSQLSRWANRLDMRGLRDFGRTASGKIISASATAALIFDGFYNWGVIGKAAWDATCFSE